MAFTLKIHFVGLIAWVFKRAGGQYSDGRALLLKVDDEQPYTLSNGLPMKSHYPGLLFGAKSVKENPFPAPSYEFLKSVDLHLWRSGQKPPLGTTEWGAIDLKRQRVWLELPGVGERKVEPDTGHRPTGGTGRQPLPDGPTMRSDVSFLTSMNELCVDSMTGNDDHLQAVPIVDQACFEAGPGTFHKWVAAAFEVPCGHLTVQRLGEIPGSKKAPGEPLSGPPSPVIPACTFKPKESNGPHPTLTQAVADHMFLTIPSVQSDCLKVHVESENDPHGEILELEPMDGVLGEDPAILLFVSNRPHALSPGEFDGRAPAWHFEAYYELSEHPVRKGWRPIPYPEEDVVCPSSYNGRYPIQGSLEGAKLEDGEIHPAGAGSAGRPICPQVTFTALE